MDPRTARLIGRRIVLWYGRNARDLPWRADPTPYSVWVSEVMLQQTVVATVGPYFRRWMERFPDVATLAAGPERAVLAAWEGMGYYRRARRLHAAARLIVERHGGRVPCAREDLLALPGVGPYIAAAVRSIAFGEDEVALDANVVRVFMRLLALEGTGAEADVRREVRAAARAALPPGRSAELNQGLMDFGSLICRARAPLCPGCFLRGRCAAFAGGRQHEIPRRDPRRLKKIRTAVAVIRRDGEVFLQRRPDDGLFAGMWEFPGGKLREGESPREGLARECREELGVAVRPGPKLIELTHYYTAFHVRLHALLCPDPGGLPLDDDHCWVAADKLSDYPMPSANRRVVEALAERQAGGR